MGAFHLWSSKSGRAFSHFARQENSRKEMNVYENGGRIAVRTTRYRPFMAHRPALSMGRRTKIKEKFEQGMNAIPVPIGESYEKTNSKHYHRIDVVCFHAAHLCLGRRNPRHRSM